MKRLALFGMCAGMLLATSCTNEDLALSEGATQVNFTIGLDGELGSRAISDGLSAKKLVYALYDQDQNLITTLQGAEASGQFVKTDAFPDGLEDNVTLTLAKGQTYTIVFWAQNAACTAYTTTDLKNVIVNYEGLNNDETRDAFFVAETFTVDNDTEQFDLTLRRPFAQINVGVTAEDWDAALASNINIQTSKAVIKDIPNAINLLDGTVSGSEDVTYDFSKIPAKFDTPESLKVKLQGEGETEATEKEFKYLSMSYILGDVNSSTAGMEFTLHPESGADVVVSDGLNAVPFQRNWRTNIIGNLLSGVVDFNIVIDPIYENEYNLQDYERISNGVSYDAASKTYYIYNGSGLSWLRRNSQEKDFAGETVKLTADIKMSSTWSTGIGSATMPFRGTFDGDNHTITNLKVNVTDDNASAGLFANAYNVKNVKLVNPTISGHWKAGGIVGDGLCAHIENCHVDGGQIISTPNSAKDNANNVGGIVGYLSAEPTASVKDCSVKNLDIVAYRDLGGIVGTINGAGDAKPEVTNNTVSNVNITANQIPEYIESKPANAGEIAGRNLASSQLKKNTASEVKVQELKAQAGQPLEVANVPLEVISDLAGTGISGIKLNSDVEGRTVIQVKSGSTKIDYGIILGPGMDFDGNGNSIYVTSDPRWTWTLNVNGGEVKNVTIKNGFRGLMTDAPTEDVVIDNVKIEGSGYALNTGGNAKADNLKLIVKNSTLKGWSSFAGGFASAEFTNCIFGFGTYFGDPVYDGRVRPYINTTFSGCTFDQGFHMDFFTIASGCKVVFSNCKVGDTVLTADNISTLLSVDMPEGKTLADFAEFK